MLFGQSETTRLNFIDTPRSFYLLSLRMVLAMY